MRAVVTGGAGFIGSHLLDALAGRGDDVVAVDDLSAGRRENVPAGVPLVVHDIREPLDAVVADARPEVVFHLAAQASVSVSVQQPALDAEVNVLGTVRVLEAARSVGAQVVFASTGGAIYGECERPAREDDERRPLSPYGTSKLAGEEYLAAWNRLHGAGHVSLRFGNVYGPRQDPHGEAGVVAIFLRRLRDEEPCTIHGDGTATRDYVYVADVVAACLAAAGRPGGVLNVGTGRETSTNEVYEGCRAAAGSDAEAVHGPPRAGDLQRSVLDPSRARAELGWRQAVSLAEGLARTWETFREE